ncbi:putative mitochondrial carrier protein [Trypanosoma rangeli]|uniref:Putative mitochondrial carrier protein n=1 Tax=Trypanosoma rangeli TaxID=5698 RepID=A0A422P0Q3_TRYRA|nr:putative mitochondrial carrier protein [Trypanosoma rangeli]RNF11271.1 putative mitochondrial carrier protein [Trypanosoma rangeli]|eukprot:RNF11271.1 putative mitochondrial carrier protein [Trypanosoma rangeli]
MATCEDVRGALHNSDEAAKIPSESFSTNAVNRSLSDLHTPTWYLLLGLSSGIRTVLLHPLNLAISRKRVMQENTTMSVVHILSQAHRGEVSAHSVTAKKGIRAIYRGFGVALFGNLLGEVTYLHTLELVREHLESSPSLLENTDSLQGREFTASSHAAAAGGVAGSLAALLIATPMSVVCNRQMTSGYGMSFRNTYRSAWATGWEVCQLHQQPNTSRLRRGGDALRGLYAGLLPGVAALPESAMWWGLYSKMKVVLYTLFEPALSRWEREKETNDSPRPLWRQNWLLSPTDNPALNAMAGMCASAVTTLVFNPFDVLHTRLQALPVEKNSKAERVPFGRVYHIVNNLIRREGWRGLFKGTAANVSVCVLDGVFFSLLFELTKLGSDRGFLSQL